jgi:hypothetical protein
MKKRSARRCCGAVSGPWKFCPWCGSKGSHMTLEQMFGKAEALLHSKKPHQRVVFRLSPEWLHLMLMEQDKYRMHIRVDKDPCFLLGCPVEFDSGVDRDSVEVA